MKTLYAKEEQKCEECGKVHEVLILNSRCHPKAHLYAEYEWATGRMTLICCECDEPVITFKIEERKKDGENNNK